MDITLFRISTCCESRRSVSNGCMQADAADHFTNQGKGEDDGVNSLVEKLTKFRATGRELVIARTRVEGVIMPPERLITILTKKKGVTPLRNWTKPSVNSFRSMSCFSIIPSGSWKRTHAWKLKVF